MKLRCQEAVTKCGPGRLEHCTVQADVQSDERKWYMVPRTANKKLEPKTFLNFLQGCRTLWGESQNVAPLFLHDVVSPCYSGCTSSREMRDNSNNLGYNLLERVPLTTPHLSKNRHRSLPSPPPPQEVRLGAPVDGRVVVGQRRRRPSLNALPSHQNNHATSRGRIAPQLLE